jgi:hypothetical protein
MGSGANTWNRVGKSVKIWGRRTSPDLRGSRVECGIEGRLESSAESGLEGGVEGGAEEAKEARRRGTGWVFGV